MAAEPTLQLIKGDDLVMIADEVRRAVGALVGDGDRTLLVDEHSGDEYELSTAVDAAQTLPFLTDRRIVVVRNLCRFSKVDELTPLLTYLADPSPTTALVLAWEPALATKELRFPAVPKKLADAVTAAGGVINGTALARPADRKAWVDRQLSAAAVTLDPGARKLVVARLADDVERLAGLLVTLEATFGPGARLTAVEVDPYLGEAGDVPPWDLTDAIDNGRIADALDALHRMMGAGARHPLALMTTLHSHYHRMVRLDGAGARNEKAAAELLGMKKSTYPAKKALEQGRKLGTERLGRAVHLLAQADLDLRGAKAWPPELVMEVLVARLARLSRR